MSGSASILLGAVLTFGSSDGRTLQLTVSTTRPSTVSLDWGQLSASSTTTRTRHLFRGLPVPEDSALEYRLGVSGEAPRRVTVPPIGRGGRLRVVVYGDSRDGSAPHRALAQAIARAGADVVVHTGDVVHSADDRAGWVSHLAASLPFSARTPLIFALGNHELYDLGAGVEGDPLTLAMSELPPPDDPIARETGAPIAAFHVRVGPALFIALDSNRALGVGSPQHTFLGRVLDDAAASRERPTFVFVAYHQGPLSSGPNGPHPDGAAIIALLERHRVTASLAGHDHLYERIVRRGVTYLVSGGGGAPLYPRARFTSGSRAFATTYNWALLELDRARETAELTAYSLEGALLDRAIIHPAEGEGSEPSPRSDGPELLLGAAALLAALFGYALAMVLLGRRARG